MWFRNILLKSEHSRLSLWVRNCIPMLRPCFSCRLAVGTIKDEPQCYKHTNVSVVLLTCKTWHLLVGNPEFSAVCWRRSIALLFWSLWHWHSVFTYTSSSVCAPFLLNFYHFWQMLRPQKIVFQLYLLFLIWLIIVLIPNVEPDSANSKQDELHWYVMQNYHYIRVRIFVQYYNIVQAVEIACTLHTKMRINGSFVIDFCSPNLWIAQINSFI